MRIEKGTAGGVPPYFTVQVDADEVRPGDPCTYLGTIQPQDDGITAKINVWVPACGVRKERDYKSKARAMLEATAQSLGFTQFEDR